MYRGDVALAGLEVNKVVDDMAFGADTYKELMKKQLQVLERCAKYGITINAQKSKLAGAKDIIFIGYKVSENGIRIVIGEHLVFRVLVGPVFFFTNTGRSGLFFYEHRTVRVFIKNNIRADGRTFHIVFIPHVHANS